MIVIERQGGTFVAYEHDAEIVGTDEHDRPRRALQAICGTWEDAWWFWDDTGEPVSDQWAAKFHEASTLFLTREAQATRLSTEREVL